MVHTTYMVNNKLRNAHRLVNMPVITTIRGNDIFSISFSFGICLKKMKNNSLVVNRVDLNRGIELFTQLYYELVKLSSRKFYVYSSNFASEKIAFLTADG